MRNSGSKGRKGVKQARHESDLRQTNAMNTQILIRSPLDANGLAKAGRNQIFLQPRYASRHASAN
jgi:hypothetical protein